MQRKQFYSINEIADEIIKDLQTIQEPFDTPVLVFHNTKVAQWFKAYYLKKQSDVLMNVQFVSLSAFINNLLKTDRSYQILSRSGLRNYIIKVLLTSVKLDPTDVGKLTNYIYRKDGSINGINLYEFADKLSVLFTNYEYDSENMLSWTDGRWEKDIYDEVIRLARNDNYFTTKSLFDEVKHNGKSSQQQNNQSRIYIVDNSYISDLYNDILDFFAFPQLSIYSVKDTAETDTHKYCEKIISAPSVIREVEALHSDICKVIRDEADIRFNDIVVYAPQTATYSVAISQVFRQGDKKFPSVPYSIAGSAGESDIAGALKILYDISGRGFFTRKDFYLFASNHMVRYIWDITDEDLDSWLSAMDKMNVYRNRKSSDDWDYLKKRLLLSVLVSDDARMDSKTQIGSDEYLAYSDLNLDFESANKLIDLADALLAWTGGFSCGLNVMLSKTDIEAKGKLLDALFSRKGEDGEETNCLYRPVAETNEQLIALDIQIPADTWLHLLLDAAEWHTSYPANLFTSGVTFLSLNADDIVAAKYVYVLGLSSKDFPRITRKNELDYSKKHRESEDLDRKSIAILLRGAEHLVCSYISRDIRKDAVCYPSPYIPSMAPGKEPVRISLDETRDYKELFTRREFSRKQYLSGLVDSNPASCARNPKRTIPLSYNNPGTNLNITDMKHFLENAFIYKYEHLLGKTRNTDELLKTEYEPLDVSNLKKHNIISGIIRQETAKERCRLTRELPEDALGEMVYDDCQGTANEVLDIINNGYSRRDLKPLEFKSSVPGNNWTLNCNVDMFMKTCGNKRYYIEPVDGKKGKNDSKLDIKYFFNPYLYSLMDIAAEHTDDVHYEVILNVGEHEKEYTIKGSEAGKILGQIYSLMTDYQNIRYMDSLLLKDASNMKNLPKTTAELVAKLESHNPWDDFADRKMVDIQTVFDDGRNFEKDIKDTASELMNCIRFLGGNSQ